MQIFDLLLIHPILNILLALYHAFLYLHIPYALGFSVIGLTIVVRIVLYPFTHSQLKTSKKMQDLSPHISNLKDKHKNDAKMLQAETMKLYKDHGVNPAAGCLPLLVQLPIIWSLYTVLQKAVTEDPAKALSYMNSIAYVDWLKLTHSWDLSFFGFPLGKTPGNLLAIMPIVIAIPLITGGLQFIQAKMMAPVAVVVKNKKALAKKEEKKDDFATAFQTQSLYMLPIMLGFFSYNFAMGLSLYWNTFTIFGILQQYKISGLGALAPWKEKIFKK